MSDQVQVVQKGSGPPVVLIPGIQGHWEYVSPAVDALSASFRVVTFSLCGERSSGLAYRTEAGLDNYVEQARAAMDRAGIDRAVICGISFGGLVALRFAAREPGRTAGLVLVSTPGPTWHLRPRHELYARAPLLFGPLFLAEAPRRIRAELRATFPCAADRRRFTRWQIAVLLRRPISPSRMAGRARLIAAADRDSDCARVAAPTLIVTGEASLERVVAVSHSAEYLPLIRDARLAILERTGHLGSITRPEAFATLVRDFCQDRELVPERGAPARQRTG